jgi:hypothetical protein
MPEKNIERGRVKLLTKDTKTDRDNSARQIKSKVIETADFVSYFGYIKFQELRFLTVF